jgi:hypothetical protein
MFHGVMLLRSAGANASASQAEPFIKARIGVIQCKSIDVSFKIFGKYHFDSIGFNQQIVFILLLIQSNPQFGAASAMAGKRDPEQLSVGFTAARYDL